MLQPEERGGGTVERRPVRGIACQFPQERGLALLAGQGRGMDAGVGTGANQMFVIEERRMEPRVRDVTGCRLLGREPSQNVIEESGTEEFLPLQVGRWIEEVEAFLGGA